LLVKEKSVLMFQKISSDDDFRIIQQGDWIVKYPLTGQRAREIDLSDERFFMLYEVHHIDPAAGIIHLIDLDSSTGEGDSNANDQDSISNKELQMLKKHKIDLITDEIWWHRP
jgi:hypothetical protein